jgi:hypothetical protein
MRARAFARLRKARAVQVGAAMIRPSLLVIALLLAGAPALADPGILPPSATPPTPEPEEVTTSYRGYALGADVVTTALILGGFASEGPGGRDGRHTDFLFSSAILSGVLAVPILHGAEGHADRAVGGFLLRGGMMSLGAFVALAARSGCQGLLCEMDYLGYGVFGGLAAGMVLDELLLVRPTTTWKPGRVVTPQVAAGHDGGMVGLAGTF